MPPKHAQGNPAQVNGILPQVNGNPAQVNGNLAQVDENQVQVNGDPVQVNGNQAQVNGNQAQLDGNQAQVDGNQAQVDGNPPQGDGNPGARIPGTRFTRPELTRLHRSRPRLLYLLHLAEMRELYELRDSNGELINDWIDDRIYPVRVDFMLELIGNPQYVNTVREGQHPQQQAAFPNAGINYNTYVTFFYSVLLVMANPTSFPLSRIRPDRTIARLDVNEVLIAWKFMEWASRTRQEFRAGQPLPSDASQGVIGYVWSARDFLQ